MNIEDIWTRLAQLLSGIDGASEHLADGATDETIRTAEETLGIELPESFRASWRIHDGTEGHLFVVGPYRLWPMSFIVEENVRNKSDLEDYAETLDDANDDGLVRGCIFSDGWTTFGDDGGASQLVIDFDPGAQGTSGQVLLFSEDGPKYLAESFESFLNGIVNDIESGTLEWNELAGQYWLKE